MRNDLDSLILFKMHYVSLVTKCKHYLSILVVYGIHVACCLHSCFGNIIMEFLIIVNCNLYTIYKFVVMTTLLPILYKPSNSAYRKVLLFSIKLSLKNWKWKCNVANFGFQSACLRILVKWRAFTPFKNCFSIIYETQNSILFKTNSFKRM